MLGWFFRLFNKTFDATNKAYTWIVTRLVRFAAITLLIYAGLLVLTGLGFKIIPTGFIPAQDQGYLIAIAQLPDGASLQRTDEVRKKLSEAARKIPGVGYTVEIAGTLRAGFHEPHEHADDVPAASKPFDERKGHPEQTMPRHPRQGAGGSFLLSRMRSSSSCRRRPCRASATRADSSSRWRTAAPPGWRR